MSEKIECDSPITCPTCLGCGEVERRYPTSDLGATPQISGCSMCRGTGSITFDKWIEHESYDFIYALRKTFGKSEKWGYTYMHVLSGMTRQELMRNG